MEEVEKGAQATAGRGEGGVSPYILTLDVGSSSVRALLYDGQGREVEGFGAHLPYQLDTTADGGVEVGADRLAALAIQAIDQIYDQISVKSLRPAAVASCTFWHNILGVDADGRPATPVIHPFDTRSAAAAHKLAQKIDNRRQHARTGCVLHASYVPAKLLWLAETRPDAYRSTKCWMSFGEYLFLKLFGQARASISMVSGSGLWNQLENDYDHEVLAAAGVDLAALTLALEMDQAESTLRPEFASRWPRLEGIPWYPAVGDGAANNVGSGCTTPDRFALMVGTSGALRAVVEAARVEIPGGLWCYRVDRNRYVLGGALTDGGSVYDWMRRNLALPADESELEARLARMPPGAHGLTVLPLFAGERSTHWRAEARGAIAGLGTHTQPLEILRAALESVALGFREIYDIMAGGLDEPREVIASGGALLRSAAWTQMMADALGRPVVACAEGEASSRGAAILALERLGAIERVQDLPARTGQVFQPRAAHQRSYEKALERQRWFYARLFGD